MSELNAFRGPILYFADATSNPAKDYSYYRDGYLVTRNGKVVETGEFDNCSEQYKTLKYQDCSNKLIVPGFIDTHVHFPQTEMIASYGEQLLSWLENYTFPTESKFANAEYARFVAPKFIRQLLKNGTTTAMVYSTVHKQATDQLFEAASDLNMLMIAGKVCMDQNCPDELRDSPQSAQRDSTELIDKWHKNGRNHYALTPRFAPTSSKQQMAALGELVTQYQDVFIQTHLSENTKEIEWVKSLYPEHKDYLDVYDHYGMVRPGAVFGHCLHLSEREWRTLSQKGAAVAFCPSSNLFLGSGLFDLKTALSHNVHMSIASDVGAGTSFNMLRNVGEAYKICQLRNDKLSPLHGLYCITQGAACSLGLEDKIGNLNPGSDADFVILEPEFDELTAMRLEESDSSPENIIFALAMLADDRAVHSTWVAGNRVNPE